MKKTTLTHLTVLGLAVTFLSFVVARAVTAQSANSGNVKTEISPVHSIATSTVVHQAGASLLRSNDGVLGAISTSGLTPGHVITMWWVIYNNPEFCAAPSCAPPDLNNPAVNGALQFGGGTIADAGGRVNFMGYLAVGDNAGFYLNPAFPNMPSPAAGIVDAKKAQIHLAIRSHGMPNSDPAILAQQLSSFPGGCAVPGGACATVQFAAFFGK